MVDTNSGQITGMDLQSAYDLGVKDAYEQIMREQGLTTASQPGFRNVFNQTTQPEYYYNKDMLKQELPLDEIAGIDQLPYHQATKRALKRFLRYVKDQGVLLANHTPKDVERIQRLFRIGWLKAELGFDREDTASMEFVNLCDVVRMYMISVLSRSVGPERERVLQGQIRQIVDQTLGDTRKTANNVQTQKSLKDKVTAFFK